ncbi:MAG TPA: hypothetical protein VK769_01675, partial [Verrucomicrobiae bacterium]|nr:hypothetical protein [Verrucomicrobiae bacterium]
MGSFSYFPAFMAEENSKPIPTVDHKPHAAFFRQSGWLMIANIIAGLMAFAVHPLAKKISLAEYSIFGTMLMVTACIPTLPLQMVFAQQTAGALATSRERQLARMIRMGWLLTFVLWVIAALVILAFQNRIMARWEL